MRLDDKIPLDYIFFYTSTAIYKISLNNKYCQKSLCILVYTFKINLGENRRDTPKYLRPFAKTNTLFKVEVEK